MSEATGWVCPRCNRSLNPNVTECPCSPTKLPDPGAPGFVKYGVAPQCIGCQYKTSYMCGTLPGCPPFIGYSYTTSGNAGGK